MLKPIVSSTNTTKPYTYLKRASICPRTEEPDCGSQFPIHSRTDLLPAQQEKEANQYFQKAIRLGEEGSYKLKPYLSYFYGEIFSILSMKENIRRLWNIATNEKN